MIQLCISNSHHLTLLYVVMALKELEKIASLLILLVVIVPVNIGPQQALVVLLRASVISKNSVLENQMYVQAMMFSLQLQSAEIP